MGNEDIIEQNANETVAGGLQPVCGKVPTSVPSCAAFTTTTTSVAAELQTAMLDAIAHVVESRQRGVLIAVLAEKVDNAQSQLGADSVQIDANKCECLACAYSFNFNKHY